MKRLILILAMVLLLLTGCAEEEVIQTQPIPTEQETVPSVSWLKDQGTPWDAEGALLEIPVSLPSGLQYNNCMEFGGDLLLWSLDEHLENKKILELCLVELDDGSLIAQTDVQIKGFASPQSLNGFLYICDGIGGAVYQLDRNLLVAQQWELPGNEFMWYFGGEDSVFQYLDGSKFWVYDLSDGTSSPVIEGDPEVKSLWLHGECLSLSYRPEDSVREKYAALDLVTGQIISPEDAVQHGTVTLSEDIWLSERYTSQHIYRIGRGGSEPKQLECGNDYLQLVHGGRILLTSEDSQYLHLFDEAGMPLSSCRISENGSWFPGQLIWNEDQGGYFIILNSYESVSRLLFWDISSQPESDPLPFTPIPEPSQMEAKLLQRCEELGQQYGLSILIGEACDTDFYDFAAEYATDWDAVSAELDTLELALSQYPTDFFRQLQYDSINGIEIQLVSNLQPLEGSQYVDTYTAFVQDEWDRFAVVVDISMSDESTYYHEFSHVIDSYLEWDSWQRDDALYSEEGWIACNSHSFEGYTYDYSQRHEWIDYTYFIDDYSTINPTEDRARVMEYAMVDYGIWSFENAPGLQAKLEYYCRCIRDAFDTTGWNEPLLWEQYLNL